MVPLLKPETLKSVVETEGLIIVGKILKTGIAHKGTRSEQVQVTAKVQEILFGKEKIKEIVITKGDQFFAWKYGNDNQLKKGQIAVLAASGRGKENNSSPGVLMGGVDVSGIDLAAVKKAYLSAIADLN